MSKIEFITNNIEIIITFITMIITWILGALAKKSPYINNNLIIIQNIFIGIITAVLYYIITKDFNMAIAMSGILAETGYNLIHNIKKLIEESKMNNIEKQQILKDNLSPSDERPFLIGDIIYNTEDLYLHETAGYGGKTSLLSKNTKSVVKKYHHNSGLYMALGRENTYYDIAWTNEYNKFIKEPPKEEKPKTEISTTENINNNKTKHTSEETKKEKSLILLFNKIKELVKKVF